MPYRRSYRRPRTTRKRTTRRGYGGRTARRRYPTTRRRYPRKMSNKRILNLTSRKKRDTMLGISQGGASGTPTAGPYPVPAVTELPGNVSIFLWCPTARDNLFNNGNDGTVFDQSTRTATTCYMRGLKETIEFQTNSGVPWQWRRICFTTKDPTQLGITAAYNPWIETSRGFGRFMRNLSYTGPIDTAVVEALREVVFKGRIQVDWNDYMTAPIDTNRVSLFSDKTTIISSGNANGVLRRYNKWYPMNKNLVYNDDENGDNTAASYYSTTGKAGMGDYYVLDFIMAGRGSTSSDVMSFAPTATLYWHEK
uniref:Capsid protein n=1 Tax=Genomoviridae sp. TaxID=2202565 RepID=A0A8F5MKB9_9VIRU|nr:MAG: capsid protein [Genomoviridae sp.]